MMGKPLKLDGLPVMGYCESEELELVEVQCSLVGVGIV